MRFTKLTRPDGSPIWFSETGVIVEPAIPEQSGPHARTRILSGGEPRYVIEEPEIVVRNLTGSSPL